MEENKEIKKSKKNKVIVIVLSLVIILLLAVSVYFLFIKKDDKKKIGDKPQENHQSSGEAINYVEIFNVYDFNDEMHTGDCVVIVDVNGDAYLSVDNSENAIYNELEKEYSIKNVGSYGDKTSFKAVKLNVSGVKNVSKVLYGNGPDHYLTFLTDNLYDGNNQLYITHDYSLTMMTNNKLEDIKEVKSEEICDEEGCASNAYAINSKNEKIDLYSDVELNVYKVILTDYNQRVESLDKKIKLVSKSDEDDNLYDLYINDKVVKTLDSNEVEVYVIDKFLLVVLRGGQCFGGVPLGAINEDGEYVNINKNNHVNIYDIHLENNKVVAKAEKSNEYDYCGESEKVELVYNKSSIEMKKIK